MDRSLTMPRDVFRYAPVAMWHEDLSDVVSRLGEVGARSEDELRAALADPSIVVSLADGIRILDVNDRLVELLGGDRELHMSGVDERFFTPEWAAAFVDALVGVWNGETRGGSPVALRTLDGDRLTGELQWFAPPGPEGPEWRSVVITFVDSTERDVLVRIIRMVSEAERAVISATSEEEMLSEVCDIVVREGGFLLAWAGFVDPDPPYAITPLAVAGYEQGGPETVRVRWDDSPLGDGPSGRAVRENAPQVVNDVANDPSYEPWRDAAKRAGVAASVSLPLTGDGVCGVLSVKSAEIGAFGDEEVELLHRLARNVTAGVASLRARGELERARASMERLIEEKDCFLATVAHELRTPLASVLGFAEILQQGGARAPGEVSEFARFIAGSAQELQGVVDDLLIAAREHPDSIRVSPTRMDLVAEAVLVLERMGAERTPIVGPLAVHAQADPARVRQVLRNLLTNAGRYGGQHVEVRIGADGENAWVEVADDGPEIDAGHAAEMFEAYVQSASLSPEPMGLGLFICRRLAERMGGSLVLDRREGWNAFRLALPAADG